MWGTRTLPSLHGYAYAFPQLTGVHAQEINGRNAILLKNEVITYQAVTASHQFWRQLVFHSSQTQLILLRTASTSSLVVGCVLVWFLKHRL